MVSKDKPGESVQYLIYLTMMLKNAVKNQDQHHKKGKDTSEVVHNL